MKLTTITVDIELPEDTVDIELPEDVSGHALERGPIGKLSSDDDDVCYHVPPEVCRAILSAILSAQAGYRAEVLDAAREWVGTHYD